MKKLLIIIATILSFTASAQTSEEIDMVILLNQVRTNPTSFIPAVEAYIAKIEAEKAAFAKLTKNATVKGDFFKTKNEILIEAKALIGFLKTVQPVKALELSVYLYPTTKSHSQYLDSTNQMTHIGHNGQTLTQRTKNLSLLVGENCGIGATPTELMLQLLIDYKVEGKGHRANIFSTKYSQVSAAKTGTTWVQDFAFMN